MKRSAMVLALLVGLATSNTLHAQDSLRILRVQPSSPASPVAPLVIVFDHPVAPKLDASMEAARVIRITPLRAARIYWRDPSTIVAEFESPWPPGAGYDVTIDPALRSASHARLAKTATIHIQSETPRVLLLSATASGAQPDTIMHPVVVYNGAVDLSSIAGHAWFVPGLGCGRRDSVAMIARAARAITSKDPQPLREAGGYSRDRRLDSLRMLVELELPITVARGCTGALHVTRTAGDTAIVAAYFALARAFALDSILCAPAKCEGGRVALYFSNPVSAAETRAHVTVDGKAARYQNDRNEPIIVLLDSVRPRQRIRIAVDADLRNTLGERLGRDTTSTVTGQPRSPSVGYAAGLVVIPRDAPTLVRVRHVNTDSIVVIVGRVATEKRVLAASTQAGDIIDRDYSYYDNPRWPSLLRDSIAVTVPTPAPRDSERIVDIPFLVVPEAWRAESQLLVRVRPFIPVIPEPQHSPISLTTPNMQIDSIRIISRPVTPVPRLAVVTRTNIAAHAVVSAGDADVWVTSLRDARAQAGALVRLMDDSVVLASGLTDSLGRVKLRTRPAARTRAHQMYFDVSHGQDRLLLTMPAYAIDEDGVLSDDMIESQWWRSGPSRIGNRWLHGSAFTDRGIYRPGERVFLSGAIRTFTPDEGYRIPALDSARWTIRYHQGYGPMDRVWSHVGLLSEFGSHIDSFPVSLTARLGTYSATLALRGDGDWRTAASVDFRVGEYRAPEFAVHLDADSSTALFAGDTASLTIAARYLFGLPMAGGAVSWWTGSHEREPWEIRIPGLEQFTFGRWSWRLEREKRVEDRGRAGTGVVGADGTLRLRVPTAIMSRPGAVTIGVSVADQNRQTVSTTIDLPVQSSAVYVGMRMRESRRVHSVNDSVHVEIVAADPAGKRIAGMPVAIIAQRSRWIDGAWIRDTVWRTSVVSAATPVPVTFVPSTGGDYEVIGTLTDDRGRRSTTGVDVWVTGYNAWWNSPNPRTITLRSEKNRYAPGDVASILVESPVAQRAWVTVRHHGLLAEQMSDLHEGINDVQVPIPSNAGTLVTIQVLAIRPYGAGAGTDSAGIYYRSGSLDVNIDSTRRMLRVDVVTDRARYQPRDSVRVHMDVRDANGRGAKSELTVWAVDEGVLSLTAYTRPAILSMLLAGWSPAPWTSSTLLAWMRMVPPAALPLSITDGWASAMNASIRIRGASSTMALSQAVVTGSPYAQDATFVRGAFATTPYFVGHVNTDVLGKATTTFRLPDNVTSFHIYAVAVGTDLSGGSGDTSIVSTRAMVVRAALPRVVRIGDELYAGAVVTKETAGNTAVSLSVESRNVQVTGPKTVRDTLEGQRAREIRFPMRVTGGDSVSFVFRGSTLSGDKMSDAVESRLAVSPPGRARAYVATGMIERAGDVKLAVPTGTDTARSHLSLQLGASALPLVRQFSEALRIYPYYCTEQLSSAGRALLARLRLERASDESTALSQRDRTQLETAVAALVARQRDDGGIGYWSNTMWTSPWLTVYALELLLGAREVGIEVPEGAITKARTYVAATRTDHLPLLTWSDSLAWPHDALAAAGMLRRVGTPDSVLERRVRGMVRELGFEDRLSLALLSAAGGDTTGARALLDAAWKSTRLEGRRVVLDDSTSSRSWLFRSTARPASLLLTATARIAPKHPLLGALFESLVQIGRSESARWWNTIDQSSAAEALAAASPAMGLSEHREISVAGPRGHIANATLDHGHSDSLSLSMSSVVRRDTIAVSLASTSSARTYYAMTLFEIPLARPVRGDEAGIAVERWYESYDGGKPIISVQEGDLVRVRLRITVPADREFVVIDDALPAGLEAVDLSLRTSSVRPPYPGAPKLNADMGEGPPGQRWQYGAWDGGWWTPWEHKEIRDDRVLYFARQLWKGSYQASYVARATTAGIFVRPPAQAEEMYNPAVRGRSDGGVFTVTRKK